jgi:hypothetical protein
MYFENFSTILFDCTMHKVTWISCQMEKKLHINMMENMGKVQVCLNDTQIQSTKHYWRSMYDKDKNNTIFTLVLKRMTTTIRVKVGEFLQQLWEKSWDENKKQNEWLMDCHSHWIHNGNQSWTPNEGMNCTWTVILGTFTCALCKVPQSILFSLLVKLAWWITEGGGICEKKRLKRTCQLCAIVFADKVTPGGPL